jgi:hypothetical protein
MTLLDMAVRVAAGVCSAFLFYVAWFVYETEEKALQSRIETWWVLFDDLGTRTRKRAAALLSVLAGRLVIANTRLFPWKTWSIDSFITTLFLCIGSALLWQTTINLAMNLAAGEADFRHMLMLDAIWGGMACVVALLSAFGKKLVWAQRIFFGLLVAATVLRVLSPVHRFTVTYQALGVLCAVLASLVSIGLMRRSLAASANGPPYPWWILPGLVGALMPLLFPYLGQALLWEPSDESVAEGGLEYWALLIWVGALYMLAGAGALPAAFLLIFVGVSSLMLTHHLVWPGVSRLLYLLPRHKIVENKKLLNSLAAIFAGVAIWGSDGWVRFIKLAGFE